MNSTEFNYIPITAFTKLNFTPYRNFEYFTCKSISMLQILGIGKERHALKTR